MFGCAPISDDSNDPPAAPPVKPSISFSATAVVSSVQLEMSSSVAITKIGAVVRLATEIAPTKAEAEGNAGYVSLDITAGGTRKFRISQHYGSDFTDGLTPADVLTPGENYKLYLYFPDIASNTEITGISITDNVAEVGFMTASLPAEGDSKWLNSNGACVASMDAYYFMQSQTGVAVCYFYINYIPSVVEVSFKNNNGTFDNIGTYVANTAIPARAFHFAYGLISGYTSNSTNYYGYWIGGDNRSTIQDVIRYEITNSIGIPVGFDIPVTRY
ncbi:hypothetical protein P0082_02990 [Candidatus Haliotispira prima]|uniref:DUF4082 domain-containing protein n=1 Tax=Candidatus Haliotispira prima TaxID=3034016 RepID=A0ABY8MIY1_9SPIO|nr:hypothetical protein P0082_02990 [Candidatus Haliotispira prima]